MALLQHRVLIFSARPRRELTRTNMDIGILKTCPKRICLFAALTLFSGCFSLKGVDTFTHAGVFSGSVYTQQLCDISGFPNTSVWIEVDGKGECIRYFHAGLKSENPIALVYFHSDRLGCRTLNAQCQRIVDYDDASPTMLTSFSNSTARHTGLPFIWLSRPGVYGSSGSHSSRRSLKEIQIVDAALDAIVEKHNIDKLSLSGQSGGGHLVTSLITQRNDVQCAVSSSGIVAVRMSIAGRSWNRDATGHVSYFDPIDHIDKIPEFSGTRIFLLGDPQDIIVPFYIQKSYYRKARNAGLDATLLELRANGRDHHSLARAGISVSALCAMNISTEEIIKKSKTGNIDS